MVTRARRARSIVVGTTVGLLALAGCGGARSEGGGGAAAGGEGGEAPVTIRFSHVVTPSTPKGQAAEEFKRIAEEQCEGVTVEVFPNSELYGDEDELQALQSGAVQMLAPASAKFTTIAPQVQVLDLPFLFDDVEGIPEVASPDTAVGQAIFENEALAQRNVKVLNLWDNGLKQLSSNRAMPDPAALNGLRFRIQPSDVLRSQFNEWGAQTTPLAFGELYNALQQGVVDGQENPYSNIESQNMHTVQSNITESNHGYLGYVLVINNEFFEGLSPERQECIQAAADASSEFNREIAAQVNEDAKQAIIDAGTTEILELTPEQRQAFADAVVPEVWQQHADVLGQDLVDQLLAEREQRLSS
jgi:C4-dicarboxylate-binding protein DctP